MDVTVGGEPTRSLCGLDQTRPRRIRLCSPCPPGRVDAVGTARSWSPSKHALSLSRSNSESVEAEEEDLIVIYTLNVCIQISIERHMQRKKGKSGSQLLGAFRALCVIS